MIEMDENVSVKASPSGDDHDVWLGKQMRQIRKARQMSLQNVAEKAGLSVGLVSQIERGLTSPSIRSLRVLSSVLNVPVSWFFQNAENGGDDNRGILVRPENRRFLNLRQKGIVKEILSPGLDENIEMMIVHVDPGGSSGVDYYSHQGEECGLVLSGQLDLWVEETCLHLAEGDSFTFESHRPHRFSNSGKHPSKVLWVVTPPIY
jgi:transcriptional regulator with XRE-family HTH domain